MALLQVLIQRDGKRCRYCGRKTRLTIEHLTPNCRGGNGERRNLGLSCFRCNNEKGPLTEAEYLCLRGNQRALREYRGQLYLLLSQRGTIDAKLKAMSAELLRRS